MLFSKHVGFVEIIRFFIGFGLTSLLFLNIVCIFGWYFVESILFIIDGI
jgi:hypothetical protein